VGGLGGAEFQSNPITCFNLRAYRNVVCVSSSGKLGQADCGDHSWLGRNEMHIFLSSQSSLPIIMLGLQHGFERRRISGTDGDISFPVVCASFDNP